MKDKLGFFKIDESKLELAVDATEKSLRGNYPSLNVPSHSRLRHFEDKQLASLVGGWNCDNIEKARRLVDLVMVSVLMDAGAGAEWRYIAPGGVEMRATEGLAAAS